MPVRPIAKTAKFTYESNHKNRVFIVSGVGTRWMEVFGKTLQDRIDKAAVVVRKLNA